jgi:Mitochondrial biogenesis AIM24
MTNVLRGISPGYQGTIRNVEAKASVSGNAEPGYILQTTNRFLPLPNEGQARAHLKRHGVPKGDLEETLCRIRKLGFRVRKVGGLKSTLLSGEGLVVDLTGPGRVLLQTRSTEAFLAWLSPLLPKTKDQPIVEK